MTYISSALVATNFVFASFENAVQEAIYNAIAGNVDISANSIDVLDDVPQPFDGETNDRFPYITIGEDNHVSIDTDLENMNLVSISVHIWSRSQGRKETKTIQGYVYNTLQRANLTGDGYKFINIMQDSSASFLDADGLTRHGVQVFNLIIEEL